MLSRAQLQRVHRAHVAHLDYMRHRESLADSDDDGPQNDDGWLYEDLSILGKLYSRLRDRQQLMELIFEVKTSYVVRYPLMNELLGHNSGFVEGYYYNILCAFGAGLQGGKYR